MEIWHQKNKEKEKGKNRMWGFETRVEKSRGGMSGDPNRGAQAGDTKRRGEGGH